MTARALFDDLLNNRDPEMLATTRLFETLRGLRAERRAGLAWASWAEGAFIDPADAEAAPTRLAADSAGVTLDFPVTYRGAHATAVLGLDLDGTPYLALEAGGPLTFAIAGVERTLRAGEEVLLPGLDAPPSALAARDASGVTVALTAEAAPR